MKGKASMHDSAQASELCIWPERRYGSSIWRGPSCVYPNRFQFLPKDSCQLLLSYSALCIFGHNNWKHCCAGKEPVRRRYTAAIITAPQQRAKVPRCSRTLLFIYGASQQKTTQTLISAESLMECSRRFTYEWTTTTKKKQASKIEDQMTHVQTS